MTYYEWINTLNKLKVAPMDYDLLKSLEDKKIDDNQYVIYRFMSHFLDMVVFRLNLVFESCIANIFKNVNDINVFSMELINYKKEINFIMKIINLPVITKEEKEKINSKVESILIEMKKILENNIKLIDSSGEYISVFEKIMASDLEG